MSILLRGYKRSANVLHHVTRLSHSTRQMVVAQPTFNAIDISTNPFLTFRGFASKAHKKKEFGKSEVKKPKKAPAKQSKKDVGRPVKKEEEAGPRLNTDIDASVVRLVTEGGHKIVPIQEALRCALRANLDLVEVSRVSDPPVCKIMDYKKERFIKQKKEKEKDKPGETLRKSDALEIRFTAKTEKKDIERKAELAKEKMDKGYRVKCMVLGKASENPLETLQQIAKMVKDVAFMESEPRAYEKGAFFLARHIKFSSSRKAAASKTSVSDDEAVKENLKESGKVDGIEKAISSNNKSQKFSEQDNSLNQSQTVASEVFSKTAVSESFGKNDKTESVTHQISASLANLGKISGKQTVAKEEANVREVPGHLKSSSDNRHFGTENLEKSGEPVARFSTADRLSQIIDNKGPVRLFNAADKGKPLSLNSVFEKVETTDQNNENIKRESATRQYSRETIRTHISGNLKDSLLNARSAKPENKTFLDLISKQLKGSESSQQKAFTARQGLVKSTGPKNEIERDIIDIRSSSILENSDKTQRKDSRGSISSSLSDLPYFKGPWAEQRVATNSPLPEITTGSLSKPGHVSDTQNKGTSEFPKVSAMASNYANPNSGVQNDKSDVSIKANAEASIRARSYLSEFSLNKPTKPTIPSEVVNQVKSPAPHSSMSEKSKVEVAVNRHNDLLKNISLSNKSKDAGDMQSSTISGASQEGSFGSPKSSNPPRYSNNRTIDEVTVKTPTTNPVPTSDGGVVTHSSMKDLEDFSSKPPTSTFGIFSTPGRGITGQMAEENVLQHQAKVSVVDSCETNKSAFSGNPQVSIPNRFKSEDLNKVKHTSQQSSITSPGMSDKSKENLYSDEHNDLLKEVSVSKSSSIYSEAKQPSKSEKPLITASNSTDVNSGGQIGKKDVSTRPNIEVTMRAKSFLSAFSFNKSKKSAPLACEEVNQVKSSPGQSSAASMELSEKSTLGIPVNRQDELVKDVSASSISSKTSEDRQASIDSGGSQGISGSTESPISVEVPDRSNINEVAVNTSTSHSDPPSLVHAIEHSSSKDLEELPSKLPDSPFGIFSASSISSKENIAEKNPSLFHSHTSDVASCSDPKLVTSNNSEIFISPPEKSEDAVQVKSVSQQSSILSMELSNKSKEETSLNTQDGLVKDAFVSDISTGHSGHKQSSKPSTAASDNTNINTGRQNDKVLDSTKDIGEVTKRARSYLSDFTLNEGKKPVSVPSAELNQVNVTSQQNSTLSVELEIPVNRQGDREASAVSAATKWGVFGSSKSSTSVGYSDTSKKEQVSVNTPSLASPTANVDAKEHSSFAKIKEFPSKSPSSAVQSEAVNQVTSQQRSTSSAEISDLPKENVALDMQPGVVKDVSASNISSINSADTQSYESAKLSIEVSNNANLSSSVENVKMDVSAKASVELNKHARPFLSDFTLSKDKKHVPEPFKEADQVMPTSQQSSRMSDDLLEKSKLKAPLNIQDNLLKDVSISNMSSKHSEDKQSSDILGVSKWGIFGSTKPSSSVGYSDSSNKDHVTVNTPIPHTGPPTNVDATKHSPFEIIQELPPKSPSTSFGIFSTYGVNNKEKMVENNQPLHQSAISGVDESDTPKFTSTSNSEVFVPNPVKTEGVKQVISTSQPSSTLPPVFKGKPKAEIPSQNGLLNDISASNTSSNYSAGTKSNESTKLQTESSNNNNLNDGVPNDKRDVSTKDSGEISKRARSFLSDFSLNKAKKPASKPSEEAKQVIITSQQSSTSSDELLEKSKVEVPVNRQDNTLKDASISKDSEDKIPSNISEGSQWGVFDSPKSSSVSAMSSNIGNTDHTDVKTYASHQNPTSSLDSIKPELNTVSKGFPSKHSTSRFGIFSSSDRNSAEQMPVKNQELNQTPPFGIGTTRLPSTSKHEESLFKSLDSTFGVFSSSSRSSTDRNSVINQPLSKSSAAEVEWSNAPKWESRNNSQEYPSKPSNSRFGLFSSIDTSSTDLKAVNDHPVIQRPPSNINSKQNPLSDNSDEIPPTAPKSRFGIFSPSSSIK